MALIGSIKSTVFIGALCLFGFVSIVRNGKHNFPMVVRELVETNRQLIKGNLQVAAFGSSNTWGAGLTDRFLAYPYLLSQEVDNFASFAGGPNYPAVCTESLVGDDSMYDVILLDYWLRASEGLQSLAGRLRKRFPKSIMIFVRLRGPHHARRKESKDSVGAGISFTQWKAAQELPLGQNNELVEAVREDTGYWYFPDHKESDMATNQAVRETNGYQLKIPLQDNDKDTLMYYLRFYDRTQHSLLNERGHELVANLTRDIVDAHIETEEIAALSPIGTWGFGDKCHLWLATGGCNLEYSSTLVMTEYDLKRGKFALEVRDVGWFEIHNPFEQPRALYVSFMAYNSTDYPEVTLEHNNFTQILNPVSDADRFNVGITRTIPAGMMPPGLWRVHVSPRMYRPWNKPFQLVGVSFTNRISFPFEYEFGPQFNQ